MRRTMPLVPLSSKAVRSAPTTLSALAGSSSAIMPFTSISAVWLPLREADLETPPQGPNSASAANR
ncbi:hypothetical protein D3C76_842430 [compost metagenome]